MAFLRIALFILGFVLLYGVATKMAESHHNDYLPYAGETWLMRMIERDQGDYTYCMDSRAASYPGFAAQLADVVEEYRQRTSINGQLVAFGPDCAVQHVMLPAFPCSAGAAACIYYGSSPVVVHYREELGYTDWRSTHGHELGHGALGLHEQYIDLGSIQCDSSRQDTVMSCGTGVRYPQARDVTLGCALYGPWCGVLAADPRGPQTVVGKDGVTTIEWGACNSLDQRYTTDISINGSAGVWSPGGSLTDWTPQMGWTRVPAC